MKCLKCLKDFEPKRYNAKYCGRTCYSSAKKKRNTNKHKTLKQCKYCFNTFLSIKGTLCSNSCVSKFTAPKRKKYLTIPDCLDDPKKKLDKKLGYVRIYVPMHHEANSWGYVYEHRIVAEQILNRSLLPNEIVHHKNGKRWDNRPENLEVMLKSDHAKLHGQREEDLNI